VTRGRLAAFAAAVTALAWGLMAVGAYVRVSQSGLGCPDWPACHGHLVTGGHHALIEQAHRWIVTALSIALVALGVAVFRTVRRERRVTVPMAAALVLLGVQIVLGGVTVLLKNVSWTVVAHYGTAAALAATLALVTVRLATPGAGAAARDSYVRLVTWFAAATFGLLLMGATVANTDSHEACGRGFPLCNGTLAPGLDHHVVINVAHRVWAGAVLVLGLVVWRRTAALRPGVRPLATAAGVAAALLLAQAAAGVAVVAVGDNHPLEVLHSALASLTWLSVATLLWLARTLPGDPAAAAGSGAEVRRQTGDPPAFAGARVGDDLGSRR
jgi:heme A synthase